MSEKTDNLLILAKRARENGDNASAARYYEQIMMEEPNNWEATFYYNYCSAATCVIRDISPSAARIGRAFQTACSIMQSENVPNMQLALLNLATDAIQLLAVLRNAAHSHYTKHSSVNGAITEYKERMRSCGNAAQVMGDCFYSLGYKDSAAIMYKKISELSIRECSLSEQVVARIKEVDPEFEPPKSCYVATAVYGSYDCPQVWTLRRYRDNTLAETWHGRAFIKTYYAISPTVVKWFGETEWFKKMWRGKLDRMVEKLQASGVESTPYSDKER